MNMLTLAWKSIWHRKLSTLLSLCLLTFGIGLISLLLLGQRQVEGQFIDNIKSVDLVVGAKGSPLQLILSSVYHMDNPTGNIPLAEYQKLSKHMLVEEAIPLSYGDSYQGFRIVGTTFAYAALYHSGELDPSTFPDYPGEVWLGAEVARKSGLKIGDHFHGNHGLSSDGHTHDDFHYLVTKILDPQGNVLDKLVVTNLESVWAVHGEAGNQSRHLGEAGGRRPEAGDRGPAPTPRDGSRESGDRKGHDGHHDEEHLHETGDREPVPTPRDGSREAGEAGGWRQERPGTGPDTSGQEAGEDAGEEGDGSRERGDGEGHAHEHHHEDHLHEAREVTAVLIRYKGAMAHVMLPNFVNSQPDLQAAVPAFEINRLFSLVEDAVYFIRLLATVIIALSAFSVFIALYQSLQARKADFALMRFMGFKKFKLFSAICLEALIITLISSLLALTLSRLLLWSAGSVQGVDLELIVDWHRFHPGEGYLLLASTALSLLAAALPAFQIFALNIPKTLADA